MGLGYDDLKTRQSRTGVSCKISGFGPDGPLCRNKPVYDLVTQGMSGVMHAQGVNGPKTGDDPQRFAADKTSAITAGVGPPWLLC